MKTALLAVASSLLACSLFYASPAVHAQAYNADVATDSITGTWRIASGDGPEHDTIIAFLPNGFGYLVEHPQEDSSGVDGFERFAYTWDPVSTAFSVTILSDSNGDIGLSGLQGMPGVTITRTEDTFTLTIPGDEVVSASRVSGPSPIVGGWIIGDSTAANDSTFLAFLPDGTYFLAADNPPGDPSCPEGGIEYGGYEWIEGTGALDIETFVDTNGECGLSHPLASFTLQVDGNQFLIADGVEQASGTRVEAITALAASPYDFNGDGKPDLLWSNTANGATYVWYMDGPVLIADAFVALIDPSWKVQGVADFNGDNKPDIVWRNTANGNTYVWYMDGPTLLGDAFVFGLPPEWVIQGVADFNADGKPDFLMRNTISGNAFAWFFDDNVAIGDQFLFNIDPSWKVEGVGVLQGANPVLLFRNMASGLAFGWFTEFSGGTLSLGASTPPMFGIDPVWEVVQIDDWNADGVLDLVFRNRDTGLVFVWYLDGTTLADSDFIIQIDPSWEIVPRR
jgi:hypothetical protein